MESSQKEMARRALQTALERLAIEPARDGLPEGSCGCAQSQVADGRSKAGGETSPGNDGAVVLIVLGQPSLPVGGRSAPGGEADRSESGASMVQTREQDGTHPGLEKFSVLGGEPGRSAARTCFIEPDRACVNSGACEMRGY